MSSRHIPPNRVAKYLTTRQTSPRLVSMAEPNTTEPKNGANEPAAPGSRPVARDSHFAPNLRHVLNERGITVPMLHEMLARQFGDDAPAEASLHYWARGVRTPHPQFRDKIAAVLGLGTGDTLHSMEPDRFARFVEAQDSRKSGGPKAEAMRSSDTGHDLSSLGDFQDFLGMLGATKRTSHDEAQAMFDRLMTEDKETATLLKLALVYLSRG